MAAKRVKILDGQTLIDIAIQELGDVSRVFEISELNDVSLTAALVPGSYLVLPVADNKKRFMVQLFSDPANKPASACTDEDSELEGIDYWALEEDFVVQ
jgi:hypothetical protein